MRPHFRHLTGALALLVASRARAQQVRGTVVASDRPVPGAVMLLLDSARHVVARAVASEEGRFALTAPAPGSYELRALRIGYAPTVVALRLAAGETRTERIAANEASVRLGAVRVSDRQRCRVRPDSSESAWAVWGEARTALLAMQIAGASPLHVVVRRTERAFDTGGLELKSSVRVDSGRAVQPFVSLPPDSLAAVGYVVLDSTGYTAWAPDPDVLLSESFAARHCLRAVGPPARDSSAASLVGIAFEPAPGVRTADVRGTLWLDRESAELRALEFAFVNTERAIEEGEAGGRAEFQRLRDGRWVVSRWRLHAPVVEPAADYGRPRTWRVRAIREFTGEVIEVRDGAHVLWSLPRVAVRASVVAGDRPVAGALVSIDGATPSRATDSLGVATLGALLPGSYALVVVPPATRADLERTERTVRIESSADSLVVLPMTTGADVVRARCGEVRGAFVRGTVRDGGPRGAPIANAVVDVRWLESVQRVAGASLDFVGRTETRRTRTDAAGAFVACDVPYDTILTVGATVGKRTAEPQTFAVEQGKLHAAVTLVVRQ